jgi:hypothetical protein
MQVSNGVCGNRRNLVSTPRLGPVTSKPSLQTVYRGSTPEKRPFERYKMSVLNTISSLPWCNLYMGAEHTFFRHNNDCVLLCSNCQSQMQKKQFSNTLVFRDLS